MWWERQESALVMIARFYVPAEGSLFTSCRGASPARVVGGYLSIVEVVGRHAPFGRRRLVLTPIPFWDVPRARSHVCHNLFRSLSKTILMSSTIPFPSSLFYALVVQYLVTACRICGSAVGAIMYVFCSCLAAFVSL